MFRRLWIAFLRLAFYLFYNPFAFTYDWVSAFVSRGHWRAWTRAALPHILGSRVLDLPCGTGNLLLDLGAAGYAPVGVDLSAPMLALTRRKIQRANHRATLMRARVETLPLADHAFDSIVMTFPPGFVRDPRALAELHRVLVPGGRLIWVDGGRLLPLDAWSRTLDAALDAVSGGATPFADFARAVLTRAGFAVHVEIAHDDASIVSVVIATKGMAV